MVAQTGCEDIIEYPGAKQGNIFYAAYVREGSYNFFSFNGFVREEAVNYLKEKLGYRVVKIELPRTISEGSSIEAVIRENLQQIEGRGERPTSPRPHPHDLEKKAETKPDLTNLKLDVLEGVVY